MRRTLLLVALAFAVGGCVASTPGAATGASTATTTSTPAPTLTSSASRTATPISSTEVVPTPALPSPPGVAMPNAALTPGATFPDAPKDKICVAGYSKSVRDVPTSEKDRVYAEYGIASHAPNSYEVDHLISLELGGSNDITNLWPEPYNDPPGAHVKDRLENWLHDQVCRGAMELNDAQHRIASNWYQAWLDVGKP